MSTKTEGQHTAEFLVSEAPGTLSRDEGTVYVPANTTLQGGTVLGQQSQGGRYGQYDETNSDGTQVAAAILYNEIVNDTDAAIDAACTVVNLNAEVRSASLVFADSVDEAGAIADLLTLGIKAR
jgi:hypothetical protein